MKKVRECKLVKNPITLIMVSERNLVATIDFRDSPFPLPRSYGFFALHRLEFHEAGTGCRLDCSPGGQRFSRLIFQLFGDVIS
jgi:hypothetical protein